VHLDSSQAVITHFLTDIIPVSDSGVDDAVSRNRVARILQAVVDQYWEQPWKFKETKADTVFNGAEGFADLPTNFGTWDRNFGWLVWGSPYRIQLSPAQERVKEIMSLRVEYPELSGVPAAVVMHAGQLWRWPTMTPGAQDETVTCFFHRKRPDIVDEAPPDDPDDITDEWSLIPVEDQAVIVDGMKPRWDALSGDGREMNHEVAFRKRVRELYRSRNLDQQPRKFSEPFRPARGYHYRIGDRYYR
jgi:hypothetical protein